MQYEDITYEVNDGVGVLTFARPEVMNAFRVGHTQQEFVAALAEAEADPDMRCLVITGTGRAFSSGADLKDLASGRGGEDWTEREDHGTPKRTITSAKAASSGFYAGRVLEAFSKPTIAAINGYCVGGGMMFALPADIRIASDQAKFAVIFTKRGLTPETGVSYYLPRLIGMERALLLTYTGDMFDAAEAERIGLVSRVVPHDELMNETLALARRIAAGPTVQLTFAKMQVRLGMLANNPDVNYAMEAWGLQSSTFTEDYTEGHRAFYEKRDPKFTGR